MEFQKGHTGYITPTSNQIVKKMFQLEGQSAKKDSNPRPKFQKKF
jgi:hypothetical protein